MDQLKAIRVFIRVCELGSFSAASEDLGYARGAASAMVSQLEKHLGVVLLRRTTRSLQLTGEGEVYLRQARGIVASLDSLDDEVGGADRMVRGELRVQIPAGLARMVLAPSLPRFLDSYPGIRLEILSRNGLPDFVGERIDAAVMVGEVPMQDVVRRSIGRIPFLTVASPAYLARRGAPETPDELSGHDCIGLISTINGRPIAWRFRQGDKTATRECGGRLTFESAEAAIAACARGAGIMQAASYLVYGEIKSGRLVQVLPGFRPPGLEMAMVRPRDRHKPRRLRVFEEFVIELEHKTRVKWNVTRVD